MTMMMAMGECGTVSDAGECDALTCVTGYLMRNSTRTGAMWMVQGYKYVMCSSTDETGCNALSFGKMTTRDRCAPGLVMHASLARR